MGNLENNTSHALLQLIMKKAIIVPLKTPRFPMRVDIGLQRGASCNGQKVVKIIQIVSLAKHVYLFSGMQENAKLFRRKRDEELKHLIFKKKRFSCYVFVFSK